jgi:hypothetical protein
MTQGREELVGKTMKLALRLAISAVVVFAFGIVVGTRLDSKDTASPGAWAYMEGLQRLDGQAIWDARSTAAQDQDARDLFYREHSASASMSERDKLVYREKARLNEISFFDEMRSKGGHIDHLRYFGGHSNGTSGIYVYETINHQEDGDIDYVWAVMTDRQGKVFEAQ